VGYSKGTVTFIPCMLVPSACKYSTDDIIGYDKFGTTIKLDIHVIVKGCCEAKDIHSVLLDNQGQKSGAG